MFDHALESTARGCRSKKAATMLTSLVVHGGIVLIVIVLPLIYQRGLPDVERASDGVIFLEPPPVAPPSSGSSAQRRGQKLLIARQDPEQVPLRIPDSIPWPEQQHLPRVSDLLRLGGEEDTLERAAGPGVSWGVIDAVGGPPVVASPPAPAPASKPRQPIRVGIGVQPPRLIHKVEPLYPELARKARISGPVVLQATVNEQGIVSAIRIISGPTLLVESAVSAVRQWRYSPTLLNGEPVPVIVTVTVQFVLKG